MIILTIRTDKPMAELGLYKDHQRLTYDAWEAHRQLAETIHIRIKQLLKSQDIKLNEVGGIAVYQGPGSFTGLRIGITFANALSYSLKLPIISKSGANWIEDSLQALSDGKNDKLALPHYGAPVHVTKQKR